MNNLKNKVTEAAVSKVKEATESLFNFPRIDSDLTVWFVFEGKEYEVAQFSVRFGQGVDHKGQPQDEVRGGNILLALTQAIPDNIYKWAMTSVMRDGSVEFRSKTSNAPLKVEFTNGYCVDLNRVIASGTGLSTTLVISVEEVTINGFNLDNHWV